MKNTEVVLSGQHGVVARCLQLVELDGGLAVSHVYILLLHALLMVGSLGREALSEQLLEDLLSDVARRLVTTQLALFVLSNSGVCGRWLHHLKLGLEVVSM